MSKSRQTTLFQSWGNSGNSSSGVPAHAANNQSDDGLDVLPEDDDLLLAACEQWESAESETSAQMEDASSSSAGHLKQHNSMARPNGSSLRGLTRKPTQFPPLPPPMPVEDLPGFDVSTGDIWIYPTNYPVRDYQYNIVQQALFKNTMVTLPTGLGKTFIAAVVMYNFYRWYPQGKIVFMAPTKPLVAQQIEACYNVMGIPQSHMSEMTGQMKAPARKVCWGTKRVFFLTPQVLMNDLSRLACPAEDIKCLVVDEAHKALGNHSYCQVVNELCKYSLQFRVLVLSATPGGDLKAVQQVLHNMRVAHIEIRSEDSIDIRQYVHERKVEKVVVPLGEELKYIRDQYLQILMVYTQRLTRCGVLYKKDPANLTKFEILQMRNGFRQDPPQQVTNPGAVEGDFAICISLYHGYELLMQHGMRSLYNFLQSTIDTSKGYSRTKQELLRNGDFRNLMEILQDKFPVSDRSLNSSSAGLNSSRLFTSPGKLSQLEPFVMSHPKMAKLQDVVVDHFKNFKTAAKSEDQASTSRASTSLTDNTRVMIFGQYRDSVQEIAEMLNRHRPLIRCMSFIGQSSAGKSAKGFTQKEQLRVVREFREGGYNTLVSTCVGEEGLDIGDVDLIVCYDAHKSPIRLVQRMGRTGRKRKGRIVMLVTEGKEASVYDRSQYNKKGIHRALQGNSRNLQLYTNSPRMVPRGLNPTPHKMNITVATTFKTKANQKKGGGGGRKQSAGGIMNYVKPSKPADRCFLTSEELAQWGSHYQMHGEEAEAVPRIPQGGHFVSLKKSTPQPNNDTSPYLSLNKWSLWQHKRQPTIHIDHSQRSKDFVELMQFVELQGHIEENDDPYGIEMETYLDEEDIVRPKKKSEETGIRRFCTKATEKPRRLSPIDDSDSDGDLITDQRKTTATSEKHVKDQKKEAVKVGRRKKRKPLEMISDDEQNSSEENLPTVDLTGDGVGPGSPVFNDGKSVDAEESEVAVLAKSKSKNNRDRAEKKSLKKNGEDVGIEKKKMVKTKKSKPKRMVIESSDDDDFENGPQNRKKAKSPEGKAVPTSEDRDDPEGSSIDEGMDTKDEPAGASTEESVQPMETDEDTLPSSSDESNLSQLQEDDGTDNTSSLGNTNANLDGSRLSLTANLSNFFPNCSQIPSATKHGRHSPPAGGEEGGTFSSRTTITPPPPSISSLDLLDDLSLSLNTTPDVDLLAAPVLRTKQEDEVENIIEAKDDEIFKMPCNNFANLSKNGKIANSSSESASKDIDSSKTTKSEMRIYSSSKKSKEDSFHLSDDDSNSNQKPQSKMVEQSANANLVKSQKTTEICERISESNGAKNTVGINDTGRTKSERGVKSTHGKSSAEDMDISFTLGDDDLFADFDPDDDDDEIANFDPDDDDDEIVEEASEKSNTKHSSDDSIVNNAGNLRTKDGSNSLSETVDCSFQPAPFDFQTPKMCDKTVAGVASKVSRNELDRIDGINSSDTEEELLHPSSPTKNGEEVEKGKSPLQLFKLKRDLAPTNETSPAVKSRTFNGDGAEDNEMTTLQRSKLKTNVAQLQNDEKCPDVKSSSSSSELDDVDIVATSGDDTHEGVGNSQMQQNVSALKIQKSFNSGQWKCNKVQSSGTKGFHAGGATELSSRNVDGVSSGKLKIHKSFTSGKWRCNMLQSTSAEDSHAGIAGEVPSMNSNERCNRLQSTGVDEFQAGNAGEVPSRNSNEVQDGNIGGKGEKSDDERAWNSSGSHSRNTDSDLGNDEIESRNTDKMCARNTKGVDLGNNDVNPQPMDVKQSGCKNTEGAVGNGDAPPTNSSTVLSVKTNNEHNDSRLSVSGSNKKSFKKELCGQSAKKDNTIDDDDELTVPQFDLGFDLDPQFDLDFDLDNLDDSDFEEMDIVPPSPTAVRQQKHTYLSQRPKDQSGSQTFNASSFQVGKDDLLEERPSSSTPLQGRIGSKLASRFSSVGTDFMSPITSHSKQPRTDEQSYSVLSKADETSGCKSENDTGDRNISLCRVRPLFKSGSSFTKQHGEISGHQNKEQIKSEPQCNIGTSGLGLQEISSSSGIAGRRSLSSKSIGDKTNAPSSLKTNENWQSHSTVISDTEPVVCGKRKSSSPLAPCGLYDNQTKRRRSSIDGGRVAKGNDKNRSNINNNGNGATEEEISASFLADIMDNLDDFDDDDFQAAGKESHTTSASKVATPKQADSDSNDDDDPGVGFRKRKKSAALPSPTTPTFKTPGKPPRKLSRLSRLSNGQRRKSQTLQCNNSTDSDHPESTATSSTKSLINTPAGKTSSSDKINTSVNSTSSRARSPLDKSVTKLPVIDSEAQIMRVEGVLPKFTSPSRLTALSPEGKVVIAVDSDSGNDDDDDDVIGPGVRRRRKARALQSPLSQVATSPDGLRQRVEKRMKGHGSSSRKVCNISSDDDLDAGSPLIGRPKKSSNKMMKPRVILDDEDGDDFEDASFTKLQTKKRLTTKRSSSSDDLGVGQRLGRKMERRKKKKSRHGNMDVNSEVVRGFLDEDAEVSDDDDGCSSDESGSDLDNSLDGFIASQQTQMDHSDMRAIYMKSVRSPAMNNRFKLAQNRNHNMDIFSQVPVQDDSYYEDSFVVQGGEEEDPNDDVDAMVPDDDESLLENTINMDNIVTGRRTRRRATTSKAEMILRQGRRIVLRSNSSSDDEVTEVGDVVRSKPFNDRGRKEPKHNTIGANKRHDFEKPKNRQMTRLQDQRKVAAFATVNNSALRTNLTLMNNSSKLNGNSISTKQNPLLPSSNTNVSTFKLDLYSTRTSSSSDASESATDAMTIQERQRLERLQRQKEQQRLFRLKLEEKKKQEEQSKKFSSVLPTVHMGSTTNTVTKMGNNDSPLREAKPLTTPKRELEVIAECSEGSSGAGSSRQLGMSSVLGQQKVTSPLIAGRTLSSPTSNQMKLTILIDSKELASSSHIVSTLKLQHNINAVVCQLEGCDFIASSRMGVEKKTWSDFANGANRTKLVDRMRHLCQLFDRPCLIIEKDRVKPREEKKPKKIVRTKYVDSTLANLSMTHIKVLFSESVEDTAKILSELAKAESVKGMAIASLPDMDLKTEQVFKFYQSIPCVSYPLALNLLINFSSIQDVIKSSISMLQKKGGMSEQRAKIFTDSCDITLINR